MRTPSPFVGCGVALVGTTVCAELQLIVFDDPAGHEALAFGPAGVVAVVVGWAAFGSTTLRCTVRGLLGSLLALTVAGLLLGLTVGLDFGRTEDGMGRIYEGATLVVVGILIAVGSGLASCGLGALAGFGGGAYARLAPDRGLRLLAAGAALVPSVVAGLIALDIGVPAMAVSVLSAAWVVWALRRARDAFAAAGARGDQTEVSRPQPSPANA